MKKVKKLKNINSTHQKKFEYDYEQSFTSVEAFIKFYEQHRSFGQNQQLSICYPNKPTKITFPNIKANAYLTFLFMLDLAKKDARSKKINIKEKVYD